MKHKESSSPGGAIVSLLPPAPTEISYKHMRFLIINRPSDATLDAFIEELKKRNVKDLVRVAEASYKIEPLKASGINVIDLPFDDGSPPPPEVVEAWFEILRNRFKHDKDSCVSVHCVAGLGRAPVLVALALIELGMKWDEAVELIRAARRGAINAKQLAFLSGYRRKNCLRIKTHDVCRLF